MTVRQCASRTPRRRWPRLPNAPTQPLMPRLCGAAMQQPAVRSRGGQWLEVATQRLCWALAPLPSCLTSQGSWTSVAEFSTRTNAIHTTDRRVVVYPLVLASQAPVCGCHQAAAFISASLSAPHAQALLCLGEFCCDSCRTVFHPCWSSILAALRRLPRPNVACASGCFGATHPAAARTVDVCDDCVA